MTALRSILLLLGFLGGACAGEVGATGDGDRDATAGSDAPAPPGAIDAAPAGADDAAPAGGHYFPAGAPWTRDVSNAPLDPESDAIIAWLDDQGWGYGRMQIDFGLTVLRSDAATERRAFEPTVDFFAPDCDHVPVPLPEGGNLEHEDGYECTTDGDCHLLVHAVDENRLYEMWRANIVDGTFYGGCLAVWDLARVYGPTGRGEQCSSADAAGFPIAPLVFTADEVAAGEIPHAIRFILPNARMREGVYVRPASHAGLPSGPRDAPPYGVRLRLRADYPLDTLPNDGARVVARAMQRYGMLLADGGNVTLTAQSDRHTAASWEGLLGPHDLTALQPSDFEVIEMSEEIPLTYDCVRDGPLP